MKNRLMSVAEASSRISSGAFLSIAGDEEALRRLPKGNWIGGTIPYFIAAEGGLESRDRVFVHELDGETASVTTYDVTTISKIAVATPADGYTLTIIPANSAVHIQYAERARDYEDMFLKPVAGWIAGVHLDDLGRVTPKVIDGRDGTFHADRAVALHVHLPKGRMAVLQILNLFKQGAGDVLTFPRDGFSVDRCWVNGQETSFAAYVKEKNLDLSLPLVADYSGAQINTSFQRIDEAAGVVHLYAPVFEGIEYRQAAPVGDYVEEFGRLAASRDVKPAFACNCVLNYLYGKLAGRSTGELTGPITFGEVAYQLLNQTVVYVEVVDA